MGMEDINKRYVETAKKHGFNPVLLKEIVGLRNRGYNNTEIAENLGISRNTVTKYLEKLRKTDNKDVFELLILIAALLGGMYLLSKLFKK
jgi:DNA-binding NarL/FixJ family response regulator